MKKQSSIFKKLYFLSLLFLCFGINTSNGQTVDVDILKSINPQNANSGYWKTTSSSAYWLSGSVLLGSLTYGLASHDKNALRNTRDLFINLAISTIISESLKTTFNRERPGDKYPGIIFPSSEIHGRSFPSGHTTLAFATATSLSLQYKKWYIVIPAFAWAGSVGYSRMYLGEHYPSDVLAGAVIGIGSGFLTNWINRKLFKN